jgi:hypothetical protein
MSTDDELVDRLRRIADQVDAAPDLVAESARAAFSTRHLDDELAELLHDSELTPDQAVRLGQPGPRMLSFEAGDVSLEIQVDDAGGQIALRGMAVGTMGDAEIETTTTGSRPVAIDDQGWFRVDGLAVEPVRVRVRAANGAPVTTGWIRP